MNNVDRIHQAVLGKEAETLALLREILAIDTSVPPGRNYERMVDLLEPRLCALGLKVERVLIPQEALRNIPYPIEGPRVNLVAHLPHAGAEPVTLYAHMDTGISVGLAEGKWIHDPFGGELDNGHIYGVGVSDVKACIASLITALEVITDLELQPVYDVTCLLTTDKHIGVYPGLYHLVRQGYVKGHIVALAGMQDPYDIVGSSGKVNVTVCTRGKAATSRRSDLGLNALETMIPILTELLKLKAEVVARQSSMPDFVMPGALPRPVTSRFNMNVLQAVQDPDIVPDVCTLTINRRTIPEESSEGVVEEIRLAVERGRSQADGLPVEMDAVQNYPAARFDLLTVHRPRLHHVFRLVQGYSDDDWIPVARGASDLTFAVQETGCEVIHLGIARVGESTGDAAEDNVRLSDLHAHTRELVYYLTD